MSGEGVVSIIGGIAAMAIIMSSPNLRENPVNAAEVLNPPTLEQLAQLHESDVKPDDAKSPRKYTRNEICDKLIKDIKYAYSWYLGGSREARPFLASTIQIYNGINGPALCRKPTFKILEDVNHGK